MSNIKLSVLLGVALLISGYSNAQKLTTSSGVADVKNTNTTTHTVGEVVYTTYTGENGNVDSENQYAYEISPLNQEEQLSVLTVFPNPTLNYLTLEVSNFSDKNLTFQLFDSQGRLLNNGDITNQLTYINMNGLPKSTYFVHVLNHGNKRIESFKVLKN